MATQGTPYELLVELRLLLEDAQSRATDLTIVGRHAAIVLLDGACEFAMALALGQLGEEPGRRFEDSFSLLRQRLGSSWKADGWGDVRLLHRMRNESQHHGLRSDPQQLTRWSAGTQRFVSGLVASAFQVELLDITVADSIEDDELREILRTAEATIETDPEVSIRKSLEGFRLARRRWAGARAQSGSRGTGLQYEFNRILDRSTLEGLRAIDDLLEVTPFSSDLAEYYWVRGIEERVSTSVVDAADARRVLRFVFAWALRLEAFSKRYVLPEAGSRYMQLRPPTVSPGPPIIVSGSVTAARSKAGVNVSITLQIANPRDPLDEWLRVLQAALSADYAQGLGDLANEKIYPTLYRNGTVTYRGMPPDVDMALVAESARRALVEADRVMASSAADSETWDAEAGARLAPFETALRHVKVGSEPAFTDFRIERTDDGFAVLAAFSPALKELDADQEVWRSIVNRPPADVGASSGWLRVVGHLCAPEVAAKAVVEAIRHTEEVRAAAERANAELTARVSAAQSRLDAALRQPPTRA